MKILLTKSPFLKNIKFSFPNFQKLLFFLIYLLNYMHEVKFKWLFSKLKHQNFKYRGEITREEDTNFQSFKNYLIHMALLTYLRTSGGFHPSIFSHLYTLPIFFGIIKLNTFLHSHMELNSISNCVWQLNPARDLFITLKEKV